MRFPTDRFVQDFGTISHSQNRSLIATMHQGPNPLFLTLGIQFRYKFWPPFRIANRVLPYASQANVRYPCCFLQLRIVLSRDLVLCVGILLFIPAHRTGLWRAKNQLQCQSSPTRAEFRRRPKVAQFLNADETVETTSTTRRSTACEGSPEPGNWCWSVGARENGGLNARNGREVAKFTR